MSLVLLLARVLLTGVFVTAGLAKLADLSGSHQALRDFGVPARLARPLGLLLPLAELVVAVALLPTNSAWWAALGALALLLLFVIGISYNLTHGRTPDCHCFGQVYSKPIGWPTLLRNLLLAALAGVVVGFGRTNAGLGVLEWVAVLTVAQRIELLAGIILAAVLVVEGWFLLHILGQQGRLLLRLEELEARAALQAAPSTAASAPAGELPLGSQAPALRLPGLSGETITLDVLRARGKPVLLLFSDPGCGPCIALLPEIGRWQRDYSGKVTLALISRGSAEANRSKTTEHGITQVLLQHDREVTTAYQATGTPSAVLIRPDGTIGSSLAQGADAIRALVAGAIGLPVLHTAQSLPGPANGASNGLPVRANQPSRPVIPNIGDPATDFSLPDLSGHAMRLSDFRGSLMLVLFWRPSCGFCQRMLPELKAWEAQPPQGAPKLLVISTDSVQDNQAMGLRSPIVLDQEGMRVGGTFGANGTPMAVLVDEEGKIASEIMAGAPAVLALARASSAQPATS